MKIEETAVSSLKFAERNQSKYIYSCLNCRRDFKGYPSKRNLFCCPDCYKAYRQSHQDHTTHRGFVELKCTQCHKEFKIKRSQYDLRQGRSPHKADKMDFCSVACSRKYFSDHIYEWRNDCKGENNPAWRGGNSRKRARIEATRKYKDFKAEVLCRDKRKCRMCPSADRVEVHHIIAYHQNPLLFMDKNNAITLCKKHHDETKFKEHLFVNIFNEILLSPTESVV